MSQDSIQRAVRSLGPGPLTEDALREHVFPLFSRVLARKDIYLANHSLGLPLDRMAEDVRAAVDAWYSDMDEAWGLWLELIQRFRSGVAELIGVSRPDAIVPKTAAGQGLRAVLNAVGVERPRVLATRGEFDSIDFILKTYESRGRASVTWCEPGANGLFSVDSIVRAITEARETPSLVVVSQVMYATGQLLDGLDRIVKAAHACGSLVMIDTYHSAGVVPVNFERLEADFAIGGSYKYLRGGPGACWMAVHPRHLGAAALAGPTPLLRTLDTGWFAKKDTFLYQRPDSPEFKVGGDAWLESTPPVLPVCQALAGLELTTRIGVDRLRVYSLEQQGFLAQKLKEHGVNVREIEPRGAFLLVPQIDAPGLAGRLKERGLNTDARSGSVRLCPDMLNTREEMARAAAIVAECLIA